MGTNLILLTAAVTPDPRFGAAVSDPAKRAAEYRAAIDALQPTADRAGFEVAVVETTGSSDELADGVKVISFTPSVAHIERGKGAVEGSALDYALTVLAPRRDATVVKLTGRLVVQNVERLLEPVIPNSARVRRTLDRRYCDSRFFVTTAGFWADHLTGMGDHVDDASGRYIEHALAYRLIRSELFANAQVGTFSARPIFVGRSGTSGDRYGTALDRAKGPMLGAAERVLRRLANKQV